MEAQRNHSKRRKHSAQIRLLDDPGKINVERIVSYVVPITG
jgi:hypothetical protein